MWRNRYTRTFEGRVEKSLRVQVPPSTIKKRITNVILFLMRINRREFICNGAGCKICARMRLNKVSESWKIKVKLLCGKSFAVDIKKAAVLCCSF